MRTRNFLLVHASRPIRAMIKKYILADLGDVDIVECGNGEEALTKLANNAFDLVIYNSDSADMPITDFQREAREISADKRGVTYIVLAETDDDRQRLDAEDHQHVVSLPFDPEVFIGTINRACNPRKWRQAKRYHIPNSKVIINVWGMEAEAVMINISKGGVLVEVSGDRSELLLQNNPKLTLNIQVPDGYCNIKGLPAKLERLSTIKWNSDYKPTVMRVVYIFLALNPSVAAELEEAMRRADKDDVE